MRLIKGSIFVYVLFYVIMTYIFSLVLIWIESFIAEIEMAYVEHRDKAYTVGGHEKHFLDIYTPVENDNEKKPVVLFVHGGGWKRGDRRWAHWTSRGKLYQNVGQALASHNIVCAVISYRLSRVAPITIPRLAFAAICVLYPVFAAAAYLAGYLNDGFLAGLMSYAKSMSLVAICFILFFTLLIYILNKEGSYDIKHPAHVNDVAQAYKWVCDNIADYGGDPNNIFLMGHSAGAHLVSLASLDPSYITANGGSLDNVSGVIGISGVYNMERLGSLPLLTHLYLKPITHEQSPKTLRLLSPVSHARATPFPFLFMNARIDFHLSRDTDEMVALLQKHSVPVEVHKNITRDHGSIIKCVGDDKDPVTPLVVKWIEKIMTEKDVRWSPSPS